MRLHCQVPLSVALVLMACATYSQAEPPELQWMRRLDEAKQVAIKQDKDLLVNFTGTEWCYACIMLERTVLCKPEFAATAEEFVFVKIDFPIDRDKLGELKPLYDKWLKECLVDSIPTIVLADADGRPYAYQGYNADLTAPDYVTRLKSYKRAREARDRHFAAARDLTGAARARDLHAGIEAVAPALGSLEVRQDDPVLTLYANEVEQITRLDADNAQGLHAKYNARIAARDAYRRREEVFKELDKLKKEEDWPEAIAYLDKQLRAVNDGAIRWRLEQRRMQYLEWSKQYEQALESVRWLVADSHCPEDRRNRLQINEGKLLFQLGRVDEGVVCFDRWIAAGKEFPVARLELLGWKCSQLATTGRHGQTIEACRNYRAATERHSLKWEQATTSLAYALECAEQFQESLAIWQEQLDHYRNFESQQGVYVLPQTLISIARVLHKAAQNEDARKALDEAEESIPAELSRADDRATVDFLRGQIKDIRQLVGPAK